MDNFNSKNSLSYNGGNSTYYSLLDLLRFLAALSVMMLHYFSNVFKDSGNTLQGYENWAYNFVSTWARHGYLGVELFFIISGFVIFNSLKSDYKSYIWSRFSRLYPLFWIICTFTYFINVLFYYLKSTDIVPLPFYKYLLNLFIINNGQVANMVDGSYWTLSIEIIFYIYIGIFTYKIGKDKILYFFSFWLIYTFMAYYLGFSEMLISKLLLVRYAPYFIFGGATALLLQNYFAINKNIKTLKANTIKIVIKNLNYNKILLKFILPIGLIYSSYLLIHYISFKLNILAGIVTITNQFNIFTPSALILMDYILLVFLICTLISIYIDRKHIYPHFIKTLKILGLATYPLYLIHQKIGYLFISLFTTFGEANIYTIVGAIIMILLSIYIGIIDKDMRSFLTKNIYHKYIK